MKPVLLILLLSTWAVEPMTDLDVIEIQHCHPGDAAVVHVTPVPLSTNRVEGWFRTTNEVITLGDLSMLPAGTNRLEFWTVCRGQTSAAPRVVMIDILRRPPMTAVQVRSLKPVPLPPMPPGMTLPLPGGANDSYAEFQARIESGKRRSK